MKRSILAVAAITLIIGMACTDPESDAADADEHAPTAALRSSRWMQRPFSITGKR